MPLTLNPLEHLLFRTLNQAPAITLDMWAAPASRMVLAALRLNLFATLGNNTMSADAIATATQTHPQGITLLLDTLVTLGYIKHSSDGYTNSTLTRKWLLDSGEINFTPFYLYWGELMERFFPKLEESLRSGKPPVNMYEWLESDDPDAAQVSHYFQQGMIALARYVAKDIAKQVTPPTPASHLLDIGGGHGEYAIALCRQHPQMSAVIFDGAQALATGQTTIAASDVAAQIETQVGNFLTDDLPTGFDTALLFNIVHGFSPDANIALLRKVRGSLRAGGEVVILEQVRGTTPLPIMQSATNILGMAYYHLLGGQVYAAPQIHDWLREAGYTNIRQKPIFQANSVLIMATITA